MVVSAVAYQKDYQTGREVGPWMGGAATPGSSVDTTWPANCESPRERELRHKLVRSEAALKRVRVELRKTRAASTGTHDGSPSHHSVEVSKSVPAMADGSGEGGPPSKADLSAALRWSTTAKLRSDIERLTRMRENETLKHRNEVFRLASALNDQQASAERNAEELRAELGARTAQLDASRAEARAVGYALGRELHEEELEHATRARTDGFEIRRIEAAKEHETRALADNATKLHSSLVGVADTLAEQRARAKLQQSAASMEVERLQREVGRLEADLGTSRHEHTRDARLLSAELAAARAEKETTVYSHLVT